MIHFLPVVVSSCIKMHQDGLRPIHTLAGGLTAVPSLAIVLACSLPNARRFPDILNVLFESTCTCQSARHQRSLGFSLGAIPADGSDAMV